MLNQADARLGTMDDLMMMIMMMMMVEAVVFIRRVVMFRDKCRRGFASGNYPADALNLVR